MNMSKNFLKDVSCSIKNECKYDQVNTCQNE